MPDFYTPDTFNEDNYKRTGWRVVLRELEMDEYKQRLIVNVATGRKYWPIFTQVINVDLGDKDPALVLIKQSLRSYTHPMLDRFVDELQIMLTDLYKVDIDLSKINLPPQSEGTISTAKIK